MRDGSRDHLHQRRDHRIELRMEEPSARAVVRHAERRPEACVQIGQIYAGGWRVKQPFSYNYRQ